MLIAQQKKKENIAEYLLYMWQVEDMLRACSFDSNQIREKLVDRFDRPVEEKEQIAAWYDNLSEMMQLEQIQAKGHLQINKNLLAELNSFHKELIDNPSGNFYTGLYYQTLPYIVELRQKGDKGASEIETCFTALYGVWMLRLQAKEISAGTNQAIQQISRLIGLLAARYKEEQEKLTEA